MAKPKIRAKKPDFGGSANKPKCKDHSKTMVYIAELAMWECPMPGCSTKALPKRGGDGESVIAEGPVELMVIQTGATSKFLLRGKGNGVIHDITELVHTVETGREADLSPWDRTAIPGGADSTYIDLHLRVPQALILSDGDA